MKDQIAVFYKTAEGLSPIRVIIRGGSTNWMANFFSLFAFFCVIWLINSNLYFIYK